MILKFDDPGVGYNTKISANVLSSRVIRERCNIHSNHNGPTHDIESHLKYCPLGNAYMPYKSFSYIAPGCRFSTCDNLAPFCNNFVSFYQGIPTPTPRLRSILEQCVSDEDLCSEAFSALYAQEGWCFISRRPLTENNIRFVIHNDKMLAICADLPPYIVTSALGELRTEHYAEHYRVECQIIKDGAKLPERKRSTDAAYDIYACEDIEIAPGRYEKVSTGIIVCAPPNTYFTIENRSSLSAKGIVPFRGIVDATYSDELIVILQNNSTVPYYVKAGDRIAQLILHKQHNIDFVLVADFAPMKDGRAKNGFGSSGTSEFL